MDTDSGGTGTAPSPHGRVSSSRASSALAALSILVILLYLLWRFIWQCRKHGRTRSNSTGGATVSPPTSSARPPPSCPPRDATAAYGPPRTTTTTTTATSPLSVLVRVAPAARFGAEKVDCAVCLAELGDGDDAVRLVPGCGHGFHAECIEAWFRLNSTCPLCRAAVAAAGAGQGRGEVPQYDSSV